MASLQSQDVAGVEERLEAVHRDHLNIFDADGDLTANDRKRPKA